MMRAILVRFGNQSFCCRRAKGTDLFDPKFTRKRVKHPPPPQDDGMELFQLEGEGRPGVPLAWGNDGRGQVQTGP
jgi:hypothetical protein